MVVRGSIVLSVLVAVAFVSINLHVSRDGSSYAFWTSRRICCKFMLRQQVLKLYRSFLRAIRDVPDEESRKELLEWARSDFKNNKHHTDEYAIKMLISHGERQLKQLQQNVAFSR
ncbi:LYR motif-containing protein 2 isoform X1 [Cryptotermes secundus]|uniref:LYR motif-containing protein 2 isoform X1 n=1 Tax=Cryptotermes secundus TaxID=105785 RepID=UPI000CD7C7B2|nr:LYR motif-containing protein 2 isoform X1 [Cryptotermes secundus]